MLTNLDELNRPKYEAISYEEYFDPMDIPEEDKEKRVEMAEEIDDVYYDFFAKVATMIALKEYLDWDYLNDYLNTRLYDTFENYEYSATRDYLNRYADLTATNTVTTTLDHQGEEYYTSDERASRLAAENAQTIANYSELEDAILAGYTHKTWKAEIDRATRKDHRKMNGKTIRIEEYFKFSDCEMLMPHDEINGSARQCANCRCSLAFKIEDEKDEKEFESVKQEYYKNATPKQGKCYTPDHHKFKNREEENMNLLHSTFGGDIEALPIVNEYKRKNPDYLWRGKYWEDQEPINRTKNAIDSNIREGIGQIQKNPGGIVLDIGNSDMGIEEIASIVKARLRRSSGFDCDVILIRNRKIEEIWRYKKRASSFPRQ